MAGDWRQEQIGTTSSVARTISMHGAKDMNSEKKPTSQPAVLIHIGGRTHPACSRHSSRDVGDQQGRPGELSFEARRVSRRSWQASMFGLRPMRPAIPAETAAAAVSGSSDIGPFQQLARHLQLL
jgi:hypothetical protein